MNALSACRIPALLAIGLCCVAQSQTVGDLDSGFAITCGPSPAVPCAKSYWASSYQTAYNDAQQFETSYGSPYFEDWCNFDPYACVNWIIQWALANEGRDYALTWRNYWWEI